MAHLGLGFEDEKDQEPDKLRTVRKKLVVVGDGHVGKTCMLTTYIDGKYPGDQEPTIFDNYVKEITINNDLVELALWDTSGQEEYDRLRPICYPDTDVILVCFAVDDVITLRNIKERWLPEVKHFCRGVPFILVGTKTDLRNEICQSCKGINVQNNESDLEECNCKEKKQFITKEDGEYVKEHIKGKFYMECSSLAQEGLDEIFLSAATLALTKRTKKVSCALL